MLVTRENQSEVCARFANSGEYGLDTETTGLRAYHDDSAFSLILSDSSGAFYFNFQAYDLDESFVLEKDEVFSLLAPAFDNTETTWFIGNAKFDMGMLAKEGVFLSGKIHDTEVTGRIIYNADFRYGVDALAKRYGEEKDQGVDDYIAKNRLYTWLHAPGKKKKAKQPHYDKVPFSIIVPYGEKDGMVIRHIGMEQKKELAAIDESMPGWDVPRLCENDWELTKTCFAMERVGIKIDRAYCEQQYQAETARMADYARDFTETSGFEFKDSNKQLAMAFDAAGEKYPMTEKGNPSFKDSVLQGFTSPLAKLLQGYRDASKKSGTYYGNFLYYADDQDLVHANIRMAGTKTGRFSYADPNLQNIPRNSADNPGGAQVRKSFIPRSDEWCFVMIDFDQMEYRLMLDYAGEEGIISKILDHGLDVHEATAEMMGVARYAAKTINFMLLYGGGDQKLATALDISFVEAKNLKRQYFSTLPKVASFINRVRRKAETGFVVNWAGRRYFFADPNDAYKAPNHLIQGGCADIMRFGMNSLSDILENYRTRMLVQVHDEIVFAVHKSEFDIIPTLKSTMENVYPHKRLPLSCGVDHSWKSWGDKVPGLPS